MPGKLSLAQCQKAIDDIYGVNNWTILEYKNTTSLALFKHKCGKECSRVYSVAKRGTMFCEDCSSKKPKAKFSDEKIIEDTKTFYEEYAPGDWEVIGNIRRVPDSRGWDRIYITVKHLVCGTVMEKRKDKTELVRCANPACYSLISKESHLNKYEPLQRLFHKEETLREGLIELNDMLERKPTLDEIIEASGYFEHNPLYKNGLRKHSDLYQKVISKGNNRIEAYLNELSLSYEAEYKITECRDSKELPFDFALLDENKNPYLLIEYDGEQHFEPARYSTGEEKFISTLYHDFLKDLYCLSINKNTPDLLRIPYWDFNNIEKIINNKLIEIKEKIKNEIV